MVDYDDLLFILVKKENLPPQPPKKPPKPLIFCSFLGSGPDRGQSPVEWGDFSVRLSVCPFVHLSVRTSPPLGHQSRVSIKLLKNNFRELKSL